MEYLRDYLAGISWATLTNTSLRILLIFFFLWLTTSLVQAALKQLEQRLLTDASGNAEQQGESHKRVETLVRLLSRGIVVMLWVVAMLIILRELGIDITPVLASAGVVGLALGIGAQNLVRDVIAGFFMILENQVRVGDVAIVNNTGGLVEAVNFRTIVLRDLAGVVHIFPNGSVTSLSNLTREWSAYVFEIGVAYKEDVDEVMALMRQVGEALRNDEAFGPLMVDDVEVFGVDAFSDSAVVIKGRLRTQPIKQWDVGREYRRRLKHAFDKAGIEIPFPHRSIYFGEASKPVLAQLLNNGKDEKAS